jgi:hypothetical protein
MGVTKFFKGNVVETPRGFHTRDTDFGDVTANNINYLPNGAVHDQGESRRI